LKHEGAIAAFHSDALIQEAAQKDAAVRRIEGEEIRAAEEVAAHGVFFLQSLGVLAEEARSRFIRVQADAGEEEKPRGVFALIGRIDVAVPRSRQLAGAVRIKKLLQNFFQPNSPMQFSSSSVQPLPGKPSGSLSLIGTKDFPVR